MSRPNQGTTIIELVLAIAMIAIISVVMTVIFGSTIRDLLKINTTMVNTNQELIALQRMQQVVRSGTRITEASDRKLTIYAYFSPQDATLSQVTYYYDSSTKTLKADKIPASGSAPNYVYNASDKITIVLISGYEQVGSLFAYYDASGNSGPFMIDQLKDIKRIMIFIHDKAVGSNKETQVQSSVIIRNRKVNY